MPLVPKVAYIADMRKAAHLRLPAQHGLVSDFRSIYSIYLYKLALMKEMFSQKALEG